MWPLLGVAPLTLIWSVTECWAECDGTTRKVSNNTTNIRSSSISINGNKKTEIIKEVINGKSIEKVIITDLKTNEKQMFNKIQN